MKLSKDNCPWDKITIARSSYLKGRIGWQGLRASEFIEEGPYLVTGTNFLGGKIRWDSCYHVSEARFAEAEYIHLKDGDVLITKDGTIGKVALVDNCPDKAVLNSGIFLLRCKDGSYEHRFMYHVLCSHLFRKFLEDNLAGSTIQHLYQNVFEKFSFPIPRQEEQTKIAEVLSTVDRAIEQAEALIAKQQRIKTGLMQDLLTKGIDEHGNLRSEATHEFKDSPLGRIPVEWEVSLLDALAVRGSGHTPNKLRLSYWNGGIKWVSLADSRKLDDLYITDTEKEISELGIKNSSAVLHPAGTVILSRDAGVGKSAILASEMAVSQHFMAWRCKLQKLDNVYLYYWLQREKPRFEGIASGSTIVTIGLQFFREYLIAAPREVDEQETISMKLKEADEAITRSTKFAEKLGKLKVALMQDLLTGKKRVTPYSKRLQRNNLCPMNTK